MKDKKVYMKIILSFNVLILCILLTSCTSTVHPIGPANDPNFKDFVKRNSLIKKENIMQIARVQWYKGEDVFDFLRLFPSENLHHGILVLQKKQIYVLAYDKETNFYKIIHEEKVKNIIEVKRRIWGVSQRIVTFTKDGKTQDGIRFPA